MPSARMQASLYHARRRRESLRAIPHLYRTHLAEIGESAPDPFDPPTLQEPVAFATKFTVGVPGLVFSVGSSIVVQQVAGFVQITLGGTTFNVPTTEEGDWRVVLAVRPGDRQVRFWNQYGERLKGAVASFPGGAWGVPADLLTADDDLLDGVSAYVAQLPAHFIDVVPPPVAPTADQLLFNSTALFFRPNFPTPRFEDL